MDTIPEAVTKADDVGDCRQYNLPPRTPQTINQLRSRLECALNMDLRSECGIADMLVLLYRKVSYISTKLNDIEKVCRCSASTSVIDKPAIDILCPINSVEAYTAFCAKLQTTTFRKDVVRKKRTIYCSIVSYCFRLFCMETKPAQALVRPSQKTPTVRPSLRGLPAFRHFGTLSPLWAPNWGVFRWSAPALDRK